METATGTAKAFCMLKIFVFLDLLIYCLNSDITNGYTQPRLQGMVKDGSHFNMKYNEI